MFDLIWSKDGVWKVHFEKKSTNYNKAFNLHIILPAKSDSEVMFCLQSYQGLIIDRSLVY